MAFLSVLIFGILSPFVVVIIMGVWLTLFIRLGLLPRLLEHSEMSADHKKRVTKNVTRVVLGIGILGGPFVLFLCSNTQLLPWLAGLAAATIGEDSLGVVYLFVYSPIWLAIIVEEWLIVLFYFGSFHLSDFLRGPIRQPKHVIWRIIIAALLIGVTIALVGFSWWIYIATVAWDKFEETYRFGWVVLSPVTGLLTIGMAVMLPISMVKAVSMGESEDQREHHARGMTVTLLLVFLFLSVVGGLWSAYIYSLWAQGKLWLY